MQTLATNYILSYNSQFQQYLDEPSFVSFTINRERSIFTFFCEFSPQLFSNLSG